MGANIKLSVVIPTRNHAELLDRTLASLASQQYPCELFEVLVIDNGSSDSTPAVCEGWAARFKSFRRVFEPEPGLHVGRNLGMTLAREAILVYADDDIQADPEWLQSIAKAFEDPAVGLVGGNNLPDYESAPPGWLEGLKMRLPFGWAIPPLSVLDFGVEPRDVEPQYVWGCNYSIRKNLLLEIGGFHPDGMPANLEHLRGDGESYVSREVAGRGYRILFVPGASIRHFTPASRLTVEYLKNRGLRQGISKTYTVIRESGGLGVRATLILLLAALKSYAVASVSSNLGRQSLLKGYVKGILSHMRHCGRNLDTISWILKRHYMMVDRRR